MGEDRRCTKSGSSLIFLLCMFLNMLLNFETVLTHGKMNNIIIIQHQKPCAFLQSDLLSSNWPPLFVINLKNMVFKQDDFFP